MGIFPILDQMNSTTRTFSIFLAIVILLILNACSGNLPEHIEELYAELPENIDFNFHVKPILSDRCIACHGPDELERKADLRLDLEEEAFKSLASGDGKAFTRNHAMSSMSIVRMLSDDPDYVMPPAESNLQMTDLEIATIAKWIDQGATWKQHWSFTPPTKPNVPKETSEKWINSNDIDPFIYQKIEEQNLTASSEANKEKLLRRVYLDLTGLPPTLSQIDNFKNNRNEGAYERVVDQLLNSDAYGERMAMEWMDVARYADSHGLHADGWRMMWPWRDWVIGAFSDNMPYDDFVTKQLAGDLLADASKEDNLATAFHRNHTMTAEGGAIDEEFRLSYVFDRAETTSTAFLGMTLNCAKCHDHKYDPISQKEYYEMTAFFNNIRELGMTGDDGNYGPMMLHTTDLQDEEIRGLEEQIAALENNIKTVDPNLDAIKEYIQNISDNKSPRGLIGHFPFDSQKEVTKNKRTYTEYDNNEKSTGSGKAKLVDGKIGKALLFEQDYSEPYLSDIGVFESTNPFSVSMWINTNQRDSTKTQSLIGNTSEKNSFWRGWEFYLDEYNRLSAALIHSKPHNMINVTTEEKISVDEWVHIAMTYDGSSTAEGLDLYINGNKTTKIKNYDRLYKSIHTVSGGAHVKMDRPLRVGKSGRAFTGENGIFFGMIDDIKIFDRTISKYEVALAGHIETDADPQSRMLIAKQVNDTYKTLYSELTDLRTQKLNYVDAIPEVMIMKEGEVSRKTYAYDRGEYTSPMYTVDAATPASIMNFPDNLERNRLGLAKWIFDPKNPLPARVTVNRYWQMIFGQGLVSTPQDFGLQGAIPSHPKLLDYLAVDLVESGWDIKYLIKKMVMSATYRQDSKGTQSDKEIDPLNTYLARGASYRLPAEIIRDNALVASGLINNKVGGKSVKPYQPEGLWIEKNSFSHKLLNYKETRGDSLYRRSLYTFVKRTSPHPMMTTFDAPNREICTVKRENTNTPLQSLVLMNDPQFVEAGKVLAQRMQMEGGDSITDQLKFGFKAVTSRSPKSEEVAILQDLYEDQYQRFSTKKTEAAKLLEVGDFILDKRMDDVKTAAMTMVSNAMLNHDEAYMKR